jgi:hypothetical protein
MSLALGGTSRIGLSEARVRSLAIVFWRSSLTFLVSRMERVVFMRPQINVCLVQFAGSEFFDPRPQLRPCVLHSRRPHLRIVGRMWQVIVTTHESDGEEFDAIG